MKIKFTIPGKAQPKQRPRVTRRGTYTPKETLQAEARIVALARQAMQGQRPLEGAVTLSVTIFRAIPKGFGHKKRSLAVSGIVRPATRPDLDNCVKLVKDSIGPCIRDDAQVVTLCASKHYSSEDERIEVTIETL